MKPIEIVCGSCTVIMRLGDELLERVQGHAGRITCKRCGNKVAIDARGAYLVVRSGGQLIEETTRPGPYFKDSSALLSEPAVTVAQHWSEFPAQPAVLDEPPSSEVPSVRMSMAPPVPDELKARRAASRVTAEPPAMSVLEAPPLVWRDDGDSLSPHAFAEVEHAPASEDYPLRLPENFKSSPMAGSLRDETFKSLYPEPQRIYPSRSGESRFARKIRENAPKPPRLSLPPPSARQLPLLQDVVSPQSAPHTSTWAPWALAAAAVVGLVVNVTLGPRGRLAAPPARAGAAQVVAPSPANQTAALRGSLDQVDLLVFDADANWVELTAADAVTPQRITLAQVAAPSTREAPAPALAEPPPAETIQFSPSAAAEAMRQAAGLASSCRKPGDPSGEARMTVTFASSGRVTSAQLSGPPFAGTTTGGCIAKQFRASRVPAFSGERVTLTKVVTIH